MREILFRGKRLDNGKWVYGFYVLDCRRNQHMIFFNKVSGAINAGNKPRQDDYDLEICDVDPETVGQYTELKDKHGVKIFEGDILRVTDGADEINEQDSDTGIGEVVWLNNWLLWYVSNVNNGLGDLNNVGYLEVIGNKWDDGDLLAGGDTHDG